MKTLFLIFFLFPALVYGQRMVRGVVKSTEDGLELADVCVMIKGTNIETVTNYEGKFKLKISDKDSILVFSLADFDSKEVQIKKLRYIKINLSPDSLQSRFCNMRIRGMGVRIDNKLKYYGGMKYTPYGAFLDIYYPYPVKIQVGYQTNLKDNAQYFGEFELRHIYWESVNNNHISLGLNYNQINISTLDFNFKSYKLFANNYLNFMKSTINLAFGISERQKDQQLFKNYGYELGMSKDLGRRISANLKATYWTNFWQFQGGIDGGYKRYNFSLSANQIANYLEFNLKIGFKLVY